MPASLHLLLAIALALATLVLLGWSASREAARRRAPPGRDRHRPA